MTRAFFGTIDGVPCVKIAADDADAPWELADDDYHRFRFNSTVSDIGYAYGVHNYTWPQATWSAAADGDFYLPAGTNASTCKVVGYVRQYTTFRYVGFIPILSRMSDLPYPSYWIEAKNGSSYSAVWQTQMVPYGDGSGNRRIVSQNLRHLRSVEGIPSRVYNITSIPTLSGFTTQAQVLGNLDASLATRNHPTIHLNFAPIGDFATMNPGAGSSIERRFVNLELPIDDTAYPTTPPATPVSGHRIFLAKPDWVGMSKAGYEASEAQDYDKMIFSSEKIPLKIARCGSLSLTAGQEVEVTIDYPITEWAVVDYQVNVQGQPLRIPPLPNDDSTDIVVQYKIDTAANSVWFKNSSSVAIDLRFFVLTEDGRTSFGGTGVVFETTDDHVALKNPATGETIIDSRTQFLPMVAQDWVEPAGMVTSDVTKYGSHMKVVSITNTGFKLYVLGCMTFHYDNGSFDHKVYIPLHSKKIEGNPRFTRSTFMCEVNAAHDEVKFYGYDGVTGAARIEDDSTKDWGDIGEMIGFRYYLFAVPATL